MSSKNLRFSSFATALLLFLNVSVAGLGQTVFEGRVISVGTSFGNLDTDIAVDEMNIELGDAFTASCAGKTVKAEFVSDYADVASGAWLGLENASGMLQLAISFGDASGTLGCTQGDVVTVSVD